MDNEELAIKALVERIRWPIAFGSVKVQIRDGKPTLVTIEKTVKLD